MSRKQEMAAKVRAAFDSLKVIVENKNIIVPALEL